MPLKALAFNATLKTSEAKDASSTDRMIGLIDKAMSAYGVTTEVLRLADFNVKPGVTSDEGAGDDWPDIRAKLLAADILLMATPIWLGQPSSVCKRALERMDAFLEETDDQGRMVSYGRVAAVAVVGNEDGAHHVSVACQLNVRMRLFEPSFGALGTRGAPGVNCEAVIFRRLGRGTVDRELDLDYGPAILLEDIAAPEKETAVSSGPAPFHPGRIEVKGDRLIWSCPDDMSPVGAHFLIGGLRYKVEVPGGMRPYVSVGRAATEATVIVRVELSNGRVSRPIIVSDPDILKAAAPNPLAGNLKSKLDAVLSGAIDLIELARDVHLFFEQDAESGAGEGGREQ